MEDTAVVTWWQGFLSYLHPIFLWHWLTDSHSWFYRFYRNIKSGFDPRYRRRRRLLSWVEESAGREVVDLATLWRDGTILCDVIHRACPSSCQGWEDSHSKNTFRHAQALAYRCLLLQPAFSEVDFSDMELNANIEKRLFRYLQSLKSAVNKKHENRSKDDDSDPEVLIADEYIARGVGLIMASRNHRAIFYIYSRDGSSLLDIHIEIRGPGEDFGSTLVTQSETVSNHVLSSIPIEYRITNDYIRVSYQPKSVGHHELSICRHGYSIPGSPFVVCVDEISEQMPKKRFNSIEWYTEDEERRQKGLKTKKKNAKVKCRIVDFVTEKMYLTEDGKLLEIPDEYKNCSTQSPPSVPSPSLPCITMPPLERPPSPDLGSDSKSNYHRTHLSLRLKKKKKEKPKWANIKPDSMKYIILKPPKAQVKKVSDASSQAMLEFQPSIFQEKCKRIVSVCDYLLQHCPRQTSLEIISGAEHILQSIKTKPISTQNTISKFIKYPSIDDDDDVFVSSTSTNPTVTTMTYPERCRNVSLSFVNDEMKNESSIVNDNNINEKEKRATPKQESQDSFTIHSASLARKSFRIAGNTKSGRRRSSFSSISQSDKDFFVDSTNTYDDLLSVKENETFINEPIEPSDEIDSEFEQINYNKFEEKKDSLREFGRRTLRSVSKLIFDNKSSEEDELLFNKNENVPNYKSQNPSDNYNTYIARNNLDANKSSLNCVSQINSTQKLQNNERINKMTTTPGKHVGKIIAQFETNVQGEFNLKDVSLNDEDKFEDRDRERHIDSEIFISSSSSKNSPHYKKIQYNDYADKLHIEYLKSLGDSFIVVNDESQSPIKSKIELFENGANNFAKNNVVHSQSKCDILKTQHNPLHSHNTSSDLAPLKQKLFRAEPAIVVSKHYAELSESMVKPKEVTEIVYFDFQPPIRRSWSPTSDLQYMEKTDGTRITNVTLEGFSEQNSSLGQFPFLNKVMGRDNKHQDKNKNMQHNPTENIFSGIESVPSIKLSSQLDNIDVQNSCISNSSSRPVCTIANTDEKTAIELVCNVQEPNTYLTDYGAHSINPNGICKSKFVHPAFTNKYIKETTNKSDINDAVSNNIPTQEAPVTKLLKSSKNNLDNVEQNKCDIDRPLSFPINNEPEELHVQQYSVVPKPTEEAINNLKEIESIILNNSDSKYFVEECVVNYTKDIETTRTFTGESTNTSNFKETKEPVGGRALNEAALFNIALQVAPVNIHSESPINSIDNDVQNIPGIERPLSFANSDMKELLVQMKNDIATTIEEPIINLMEIGTNIQIKADTIEFVEGKIFNESKDDDMTRQFNLEITNTSNNKEIKEANDGRNLKEDVLINIVSQIAPVIKLSESHKNMIDTDIKNTSDIHEPLSLLNNNEPELFLQMSNNISTPTEEPIDNLKEFGSILLIKSAKNEFVEGQVVNDPNDIEGAIFAKEDLNNTSTNEEINKSMDGGGLKETVTIDNVSKVAPIAKLFVSQKCNSNDVVPNTCDIERQISLQNNLEPELLVLMYGKEMTTTEPIINSKKIESFILKKTDTKECVKTQIVNAPKEIQTKTHFNEDSTNTQNIEENNEIDDRRKLNEAASIDFALEVAPVYKVSESTLCYINRDVQETPDIKTSLSFPNNDKPELRIERNSDKSSTPTEEQINNLEDIESQIQIQSDTNEFVEREVVNESKDHETTINFSEDLTNTPYIGKNKETINLRDLKEAASLDIALQEAPVIKLPASPINNIDNDIQNTPGIEKPLLYINNDEPELIIERNSDMSTSAEEQINNIEDIASQLQIKTDTNEFIEREVVNESKDNEETRNFNEDLTNTPLISTNKETINLRDLKESASIDIALQEVSVIKLLASSINSIDNNIRNTPDIEKPLLYINNDEPELIIERNSDMSTSAEEKTNNLKDIASQIQIQSHTNEFIEREVVNESKDNEATRNLNEDLPNTSNISKNKETMNLRDLMEAASIDIALQEASVIKLPASPINSIDNDIQNTPDIEKPLLYINNDEPELIIERNCGISTSAEEQINNLVDIGSQLQIKSDTSEFIEREVVNKSKDNEATRNLNEDLTNTSYISTNKETINLEDLKEAASLDIALQEAPVIKLPASPINNIDNDIQNTPGIEKPLLYINNDEPELIIERNSDMSTSAEEQINNIEDIASQLQIKTDTNEFIEREVVNESKDNEETRNFNEDLTNTPLISTNKETINLRDLKESASIDIALQEVSVIKLPASSINSIDNNIRNTPDIEKPLLYINNDEPELIIERNSDMSTSAEEKTNNLEDIASQIQIQSHTNEFIEREVVNESKDNEATRNLNEDLPNTSNISKNKETMNLRDLMEAASIDIALQEASVIKLPASPINSIDNDIQNTPDIEKPLLYINNDEPELIIERNCGISTSAEEQINNLVDIGSQLQIKSDTSEFIEREVVNKSKDNEATRNLNEDLTNTSYISTNKETINLRDLKESASIEIALQEASVIKLPAFPINSIDNDIQNTPDIEKPLLYINNDEPELIIERNCDMSTSAEEQINNLVDIGSQLQIKSDTSEFIEREVVNESKDNEETRNFNEDLTNTPLISTNKETINLRDLKKAASIDIDLQEAPVIKLPASPINNIDNNIQNTPDIEKPLLYINNDEPELIIERNCDISTSAEEQINNLVDIGSQLQIKSDTSEFIEREVVNESKDNEATRNLNVNLTNTSYISKNKETMNLRDLKEAASIEIALQEASVIKLPASSINNIDNDIQNIPEIVKPLLYINNDKPELIIKRNSGMSTSDGEQINKLEDIASQFQIKTDTNEFIEREVVHESKDNEEKRNFNEDLTNTPLISTNKETINLRDLKEASSIDIALQEASVIKLPASSINSIDNNIRNTHDIEKPLLYINNDEPELITERNCDISTSAEEQINNLVDIGSQLQIKSDTSEFIEREVVNESKDNEATRNLNVDLTNTSYISKNKETINLRDLKKAASIDIDLQEAPVIKLPASPINNIDNNIQNTPDIEKPLLYINNDEPELIIERNCDISTSAEEQINNLEDIGSQLQIKSDTSEFIEREVVNESKDNEETRNFNEDVTNTPLISTNKETINLRDLKKAASIDIDLQEAPVIKLPASPINNIDNNIQYTPDIEKPLLYINNDEPELIIERNCDISTSAEEQINNLVDIGSQLQIKSDTSEFIEREVVNESKDNEATRNLNVDLTNTSYISKNKETMNLRDLKEAASIEIALQEASVIKLPASSINNIDNDIQNIPEIEKPLLYINNDKPELIIKRNSGISTSDGEQINKLEDIASQFQIKTDTNEFIEREVVNESKDNEEKRNFNEDLTNTPHISTNKETINLRDLKEASSIDIALQEASVIKLPASSINSIDNNIRNTHDIEKPLLYINNDEPELIIERNSDMSTSAEEQINNLVDIGSQLQIKSDTSEFIEREVVNESKDNEETRNFNEDLTNTPLISKNKETMNLRDLKEAASIEIALQEAPVIKLPASSINNIDNDIQNIPEIEKPLLYINNDKPELIIERNCDTSSTPTEKQINNLEDIASQLQIKTDTNEFIEREVVNESKDNEEKRNFNEDLTNTPLISTNKETINLRDLKEASSIDIALQEASVIKLPASSINSIDNNIRNTHDIEKPLLYINNDEPELIIERNSDMSTSAEEKINNLEDIASQIQTQSDTNEFIEREVVNESKDNEATRNLNEDLANTPLISTNKETINLRDLKESASIEIALQEAPVIKLPASPINNIDNDIQNIPDIEKPLLYINNDEPELIIERNCDTSSTPTEKQINNLEDIASQIQIQSDTSEFIEREVVNESKDHETTINFSEDLTNTPYIGKNKETINLRDLKESASIEIALQEASVIKLPASPINSIDNDIQNTPDIEKPLLYINNDEPELIIERNCDMSTSAEEKINNLEDIASQIQTQSDTNEFIEREVVNESKDNEATRNLNEDLTNTPLISTNKETINLRDLKEAASIDIDLQEAPVIKLPASPINNIDNDIQNIPDIEKPLLYINNDEPELIIERNCDTSLTPTEKQINNLEDIASQIQIQSDTSEFIEREVVNESNDNEATINLNEDLTNTPLISTNKEIFNLRDLKESASIEIALQEASVIKLPASPINSIDNDIQNTPDIEKPLLYINNDEPELIIERNCDISTSAEEQINNLEDIGSQLQIKSDTSEFIEREVVNESKDNEATRNLNEDLTNTSYISKNKETMNLRDLKEAASIEIALQEASVIKLPASSINNIDNDIQNIPEIEKPLLYINNDKPELIIERNSDMSTSAEEQINNLEDIASQLQIKTDTNEFIERGVVNESKDNEEKRNFNEDLTNTPLISTNKETINLRDLIEASSIDIALQEASVIKLPASSINSIDNNIRNTRDIEKPLFYINNDEPELIIERNCDMSTSAEEKINNLEDIASQIQIQSDTNEFIEREVVNESKDNEATRNLNEDLTNTPLISTNKETINLRDLKEAASIDIDLQEAPVIKLPASPINNIDNDIQNIPDIEKPLLYINNDEPELIIERNSDMSSTPTEEQINNLMDIRSNILIQSDANEFVERHVVNESKDYIATINIYEDFVNTVNNEENKETNAGMTLYKAATIDIALQEAPVLKLFESQKINIDTDVHNKSVIKSQLSLPNYDEPELLLQVNSDVSTSIKEPINVLNEFESNTLFKSDTIEFVDGQVIEESKYNEATRNFNEDLSYTANIEKNIEIITKRHLNEAASIDIALQEAPILKLSKHQIFVLENFCFNIDQDIPILKNVETYKNIFYGTSKLDHSTRNVKLHDKENIEFGNIVSIFTNPNQPTNLCLCKEDKSKMLHTTSINLQSKGALLNSYNEALVNQKLMFEEVDQKYICCSDKLDTDCCLTDKIKDENIHQISNEGINNSYMFEYSSCYSSTDIGPHIEKRTEKNLLNMGNKNIKHSLNLESETLINNCLTTCQVRCEDLNVTDEEINSNIETRMETAQTSAMKTPYIKDDDFVIFQDKCVLENPYYLEAANNYCDILSIEDETIDLNIIKEISEVEDLPSPEIITIHEIDGYSKNRRIIHVDPNLLDINLNEDDMFNIEDEKLNEQLLDEIKVIDSLPNIKTNEVKTNLNASHLTGVRNPRLLINYTNDITNVEDEKIYIETPKELFVPENQSSNSIEENKIEQMFSAISNDLNNIPGTYLFQLNDNSKNISESVINIQNPSYVELGNDNRSFIEENIIQGSNVNSDETSMSNNTHESCSTEQHDVNNYLVHQNLSTNSKIDFINDTCIVDPVENNYLLSLQPSIDSLQAEAKCDKQSFDRLAHFHDNNLSISSEPDSVDFHMWSSNIEFDDPSENFTKVLDFDSIISAPNLNEALQKLEMHIIDRKDEFEIFFERTNSPSISSLNNYFNHGIPCCNTGELHAQFSGGRLQVDEIKEDCERNIEETTLTSTLTTPCTSITNSSSFSDSLQNEEFETKDEIDHSETDWIISPYQYPRVLIGNIAQMSIIDEEDDSHKSESLSPTSKIHEKLPNHNHNNCEVSNSICDISTIYDNPITQDNYDSLVDECIPSVKPLEEHLSESKYGVEIDSMESNCANVIHLKEKNSGFTNSNTTAVVDVGKSDLYSSISQSTDKSYSFMTRIQITENLVNKSEIEKNILNTNEFKIDKTQCTKPSVQRLNSQQFTDHITEIENCNSSFNGVFDVESPQQSCKKDQIKKKINKKIIINQQERPFQNSTQIVFDPDGKSISEEIIDKFSVSERKVYWDMKIQRLHATENQVSTSEPRNIPHLNSRTVLQLASCFDERTHKNNYSTCVSWKGRSFFPKQQTHVDERTTKQENKLLVNKSNESTEGNTHSILGTETAVNESASAKFVSYWRSYWDGMVSEQRVNTEKVINGENKRQFIRTMEENETNDGVAFYNDNKCKLHSESKNVGNNKCVQSGPDCGKVNIMEVGKLTNEVKNTHILNDACNNGPSCGIHLSADSDGNENIVSTSESQHNLIHYNENLNDNLNNVVTLPTLVDIDSSETLYIPNAITNIQQPEFGNKAMIGVTCVEEKRNNKREQFSEITDIGQTNEFKMRFEKAKQYFKHLEQSGVGEIKGREYRSMPRLGLVCSKARKPSFDSDSGADIKSKNQRGPHKSRRKKRRKSTKVQSAPTSDTETFKRVKHEDSFESFGGSVKSVKLSERFHVKDLFRDVSDNGGIFKGIPNRTAVLASLRSVDDVRAISPYQTDTPYLKPSSSLGNIPSGFQEEYPYLPTTPVHRFRPRSALEFNLIAHSELLDQQF